MANDMKSGIGFCYSGSRRRRLFHISPYGRISSQYYHNCLWYLGMVPIYVGHGIPYAGANGQYDNIVRRYAISRDFFLGFLGLHN
ncbi:MAG: hypothetical protein Ct9H300mP29_7120 [Candidatus Neomarinimicrobiota bacterium]|nr:MAG: hypothetical protein Ct9H300mP29_7120 [Candidatus Neomarinimicrobiota bacterium]